MKSFQIYQIINYQSNIEATRVDWDSLRRKDRSQLVKRFADLCTLISCLKMSSLLKTSYVKFYFKIKGSCASDIY